MRSADLLILSLFRSPGRFLLGVLPMCFAFCGYSLLESLGDAGDFSAELDRARRVVTINRQSIMQPLPVAYASRIAELDGIAHVSFATWFGGFYREPENRFSQYAVDERTYFDVYPEIRLDDESRRRWLDDRRSALVSARLAKKFGWRPGDLVTLTSTIWQTADGGSDWLFVIAGLIPDGGDGIEPEMFLLRHDYFEEGRRFARGTISYAVSKLSRSAHVDEVIARIDGMFKNGTTPTFSSTESDFVESFQRQLGDLGLITRLVTAIVVLVVLLMTSSSLAQSIAERERELAVMRALGFSRRHIAMQLALEAVMSVAFSALAALFLTAVMLAILRSYDVGNGVFDTSLSFTDSLGVLLLAAILGVTGALFPLLMHARSALAANLRE